MRAPMLTQLLLAAVAMVVLTACRGDATPRQIAYDHERCAYCHMAIADRRFGAQFVSEKGKAYSFDSVECLASYLIEHQEDAGTAWVTDFTRPGTLIRADGARFERSGDSLSWTDVLAAAAGVGQPTHGAIRAIDGVDNASR